MKSGPSSRTSVTPSMSHVGPSVKERPAPLIDHLFLWSHDCPHLNLWIWGPFFSRAVSSRILYGHCCDFSVMDPFRRQTPATKCSVSGTIQIFVSLEVWLTELKSLNETGHSPWGQKLLCTELPRNSFCRRLMYKEYAFGTNTWEGLDGGKLTNDIFQWRTLLTLQNNSEPSQDGVRGLTPQEWYMSLSKEASLSWGNPTAQG